MELAAVRAAFDEAFEAWEIVLPEEDVLERRAGHLRQANGSGSVRYVFGRDERGEYLEYYAFHRIAGDAHARIYSGGERVGMDTLVTFYVSPPGDPDAAERNRRQMQERNERLLAELEAAGVLSGGPVPASFTVNAYLTTKEEPRDPAS